MNKKITVITATIGRDSLHDTIESVRAQKVPCHHIVVFDGVTPTVKDDENLTVMRTPTRTGFHGYYGHRVYAGISLLVNTPFVSFLDDDNTLEPNWSEKMVEAMYATDTMPMAVTCRRNLVRRGEMLGVDNRESIGKNEWGYVLYDTNTYLIQTPIMKELSALLCQRFVADRYLAEYLHENRGVRHITDPLVNYEVNDDRYLALLEVVK